MHRSAAHGRPPLLAVTAALALLSGPVTAVAHGEEAADAYFRTALGRIRTTYNVPAMGGVLVVNGKVVVAGAVGVRQQGTTSAVTDNDKFPIGSITKTFTGLVAAKLTQTYSNGKPLLTWDTKLKDVFPTLSSVSGIQSDYLGKTVAQFLTHQADLPNTPDETTSCDKSNFNDYMICGRLDYLKKNLKVTPDPTVDYSNVDPVVVAAMCQQKTGKIWEELLRQYLYNPLGMSAGFISNAYPNNAADPKFHSESGATNVYVPYTEADKYNIAAPAGHVMISPPDMGKYLIELMPGAAGRVGVLNASVLKEYLNQLNTNRRVARGGWIIEANTGENNSNWAPGQKILWHNGSHCKNYSHAYLLPNAKVGFCTMANCGSCTATSPRGNAAVNAMNEQFKVMWYNHKVLTFFAGAASFAPTVSGTASGSYSSGNLSDTDMLTTWKANAANSTLQLAAGSPLARITGLILITPRNRGNISSMKLYATTTGNVEQQVYSGPPGNSDNTVFEFNPALASSKLRLEFANNSGTTTELAEVLMLYDDPLRAIRNKLSGLKAIDKKVIQPPPVLTGIDVRGTTQQRVQQRGMRSRRSQPGRTAPRLQQRGAEGATQ